jgi:hypothetical protein
VSFPWINQAVRRSSDRDLEARREQVRKELGQRAAMYYRLRFSKERALDRLRANVAWDYSVGAVGRPSWLTDDELEKIVNTTYARRPTIGAR